MKAKLNQGILDTYKAINLFGSNYTLKAKSSAFRKPQESPHKPEVLCSKIIEPLFLSKWKRKAKVWCKWQIRPRSNEKKHGYSPYVREEASHWKTGQLSYIKKRKNEKRKTPLWPQWCENRWSVTESSSFCSVYAHGHAHTRTHTHRFYILELPIRCVKHKTESSVKSLAKPCSSVCSNQVSVTGSSVNSSFQSSAWRQLFAQVSARHEMVYGLHFFVCARVWLFMPPRSPPDSSAHGILQARILEWVAMPSSRASSWPRNQTHVSCTAGGFFTTGPLWKPMAWKVSH